MVRVNFAEIEEFQKLPSGRYHFAVTDVDLGEGTEKEPESEYWSIKCTVQDGELQGRTESLWCGLPPHYEPFTLAQLLRATVGQHEWTKEQLEDGEYDVEMDDIMGLEFIGVVKPSKKNKEFNQVRIEPYDEDEWDSDENLLP